MNDLFFRDIDLIKRDEQQYDAYKSMVNTVLIAGPGSGKTKVLSLKAVTLAKSQINKPSGLACISYSRETVRVLKKRIRSYGYIPNNKDFIGTIHSFSLLHIIQPFAKLYPQYNIKFPIKILPDEVKVQIFQSVIKELEIENHKELTLSEINKHRSLSINGRSSVKIESNKLVAKGSSLYEKKLKQTEYIDFIDIINISAKIIHEQKYVRQSLQSQFPWLLIDEYQDLGKALHEMVLELIINTCMKLYVVGDVNQSIYGFNGGYPDFLLELTTYGDVKTVFLDSNYRSSQPIIDASLAALKPTPPFPKYTAEKRKDDLANFTFITCEKEMEEQYDVVSKKVIPNLLKNAIPYNEIGIITNTNVQIQEMAYYLKRVNIPFYIVNWSFENSAILVWLQECADWCTDKNKQSFEELFKFWNRLINNHNDSRKEWESIRLKTFFYDTLIKSIKSKDLLEWLNLIVSRLRLCETLVNSEEYPNEIDNIGKLLDEVNFHNLKNANIQRFANLGFPENEVTITTRHSSKGLEFEAVIMLGMEEEHFPHYYHLENESILAEDQRLCYVCISRAKNVCILIRSKIFTLDTRRGPWEKPYDPSRYWVSLYDKFGNNKNSFSNITYI